MTGMPLCRVLNSYVHLGRIGVLVEFGCDTDFLASTEEFRCLINDVTLHIAAFGAEDVESLLEQPFVKDETKTLSRVLDEASRQFKERVAVVRFIRWVTGDYERPVESPPPRGPAVIYKFDCR